MNLCDFCLATEKRVVVGRQYHLGDTGSYLQVGPLNCNKVYMSLCWNMFTCIQNTTSLSGCAMKSFILVPISLRCTSRKVQTSHPHSSFDVTKAKKCRSHILRAAIIKLWWKWSLRVAFNFSLSDHFTCQIQNQHKRFNFMWFLIGLKNKSGH